MSLHEILAEIPRLSDTEIRILETAIRERMVQTPSVFSVAGHLLDGVDDLPGDLSTNPKYMEGFGQ
jgi:hypothetical protein